MGIVKGTTAVIALSMFLFVTMTSTVYSDTETSTRWEIEKLEKYIATLEDTVAAQKHLIVSLTEAVEALQSADALLEAKVSNNTQAILSNQTNDSLQDEKIFDLQNTGNDINTKLTSLRDNVDTLSEQVITLGESSIFDLEDYVSVYDSSDINGLIGPHILFEGVNVHIRNLNGTTDGHPNGLGNLIVGYNEKPDNMQEWQRMGSHNLIVGPKHTYTGYGSFIAGFGNGTILNGPYATVTGGKNNQATGYASTISGSISNSASSNYYTVSGGELNSANHDYSTVSGGYNQVTNIYHDHLP